MTEKESLSKNLQEFEEDSRWFYSNLNLLRQKNLSRKFVAIKNKSVIAEGETIEIVISAVEKKGENPACMVIEFVYPEGTVILL